MDFDGLCFPEERWNDFAVVICGWWLQALTALYRGELVAVECRFMDGPYVFKVSPGEHTLWKVVCARDETIFGDKKLSIKLCKQVKAADCLRKLSQVGQDLLVACESQGWSDADTGLLGSLIEVAESELCYDGKAVG